MAIEMDEYEWIKEYTAYDEYVLWTGKPGKGGMFTKNDIFLIPFSVVWFGFAIFWETLALKHDEPFQMALFGLPFIAVGFYIAIGRFIHEKLSRKQTFYAITNKNIIFKTGKKVRILDRDKLPALDLTVLKGGRGTISFENFIRNANNNFAFHSSNALQFKNIENVKQVWDILKNPENHRFG